MNALNILGKHAKTLLRAGSWQGEPAGICMHALLETEICCCWSLCKRVQMALNSQWRTACLPSTKQRNHPWELYPHPMWDIVHPTVAARVFLAAPASSALRELSSTIAMVGVCIAIDKADSAYDVGKMHLLPRPQEQPAP